MILWGLISIILPEKAAISTSPTLPTIYINAGDAEAFIASRRPLERYDRWPERTPEADRRRIERHDREHRHKGVGPADIAASGLDIAESPRRTEAQRLRADKSDFVPRLRAESGSGAGEPEPGDED